MPELPEVEVIRRGLAPHLVGRRFLRVSVGEKSLRRQSPALELEGRLVGRRLAALRRRGKYLVFALEDGGTLLVHLGMTGHLLLG
ncbi:MAG: DNA-formamidopyrimidine glycosylase family protein, partial [Desulfobaccales bacterium]